ncbi:MAG TPA: winged helix-turn-helix domain-containing protein [Blastocatellia bacterium]|nr:winged helix-turn-helix domain-containing protein [Blastocatellia bacterium]
MSPREQHRSITYYFDDVAVDCDNFRVLKRGEAKAVEPRAFDVLIYLIEHRGRVVEKQELFDQVWKETFVTDGALTRIIKEIRQFIGDDAGSPRYLETLPKRGYRFIAFVEEVPSAAGEAPEQGAVESIDSLAVLPFANLNADPEQDYFVEGITDLLITDLGKIGALKVISRTSVMQYKQARKPLPEIAEELRVKAVVEGSVLRVGERVRITVQLIEAATDRHLWAESYERDLRDVLALQSEVAQAIAREIQVALTPEEKVRLASVHPVNPEAHLAYLKGHYFLEKYSPDSIMKAIDCFQLAIEKDPNYAAAYAGLAYVYGVFVMAGFAPPRETIPKARAAVLKAVEMDDTLADAHSSWAESSFSMSGTGWLPKGSSNELSS